MATSDHAVIVHFSYGSTDLSRLFELEDKIVMALETANAGEFDGNEMAADGSDGFLYMYGPDADMLFDVIRPILESSEFMRASKVKLRYGPPNEGSREVDIEIGV